MAASVRLATRKSGSIRLSSVGSATGAAVDEHDGEEYQHQHAADVDEQLGQREESRIRSTRRSQRLRAGSAEPQRHAQHVSREQHGERADDRDERSEPQKSTERQRAHGATSSRCQGYVLRVGEARCPR